VHGLIFAGLREFSGRRLGEHAAAELWAGRTYETTAAYSDDEFRERVSALGEAIGIGEDELLRDFGAFAGETTFVGLFPDSFHESSGTLEFLLGVEHRIHDLVRATIPGAAPPNLHVRPLGDDGVLVSYTSDRRLCRLLEGLVRGTAAHYREDVEVEELQCMLDGDAGCVWSVVRA
jgi:Haem-NO-binding